MDGVGIFNVTHSGVTTFSLLISKSLSIDRLGVLQFKDTGIFWSSICKLDESNFPRLIHDKFEFTPSLIIELFTSFVLQTVHGQLLFNMFIKLSANMESPSLFKCS